MGKYDLQQSGHTFPIWSLLQVILWLGGSPISKRHNLLKRRPVVDHIGRLVHLLHLLHWQISTRSVPVKM